LYGPDGVQVGEDGLKFIEHITKEGLVDLWDINIGDIAEWGEDAGPSRFYKANHQAPWRREVKSIAKVPVLGVGRITSPDDMVNIIRSGDIDIIGAARPSIADPFLPKKIEEGRPEDIRECIGCNVCISRWEIGGPPMICTQNATAMEEYRRGWHPEKFEKAKDPCAVLVVGAGPSGMECARVLGERGYDVHLAEASDEIGGSVKNVQRYPGLSEWGRVITYRQIQLNKMRNVEVHTGVGQMSADDVLKYGADKVVVAVGSHWNTDGFCAAVMAPLEGADAAQPHILTPEQVMDGKAVGDKVVILDGDGYFTGICMAEMMVDQGKDVTIVTPLGAVAPYTEFTLEAPNLHRMMHEKGIKSMTGTWVNQVKKGEVQVYNMYADGFQRTTEPKTGELPRRKSNHFETLQADSVILVTGRRSNSGLFTELKSRRSEWEKEGIQAIYHIGDCYAPRLIADCVFDGHRLAREFESPNPQYPLPFIRERQVWGHETFPKLGDPHP
ncbi:MAG: FAD-dependent oxidoreductase, partial [Alphaproteobacteria bacterium]